MKKVKSKIILSQREIRDKAIAFVHEWKGTESEAAEKQSFWNAFFEIFGITRKRVAFFEASITKLSGRGSIDLFWPGTLLVEHKSKGIKLESAYHQAFDYFQGLEQEELPKYIIVSDFDKFRLHDVETKKDHYFTLSELPDNLHLFDFISGYKKQEYQDEDPVNIDAANLMGELHDALFGSGYTGHNLEVLLVRILYCLFADDTGIFPKDHFRYYFETYTKGPDTGPALSTIFQTLNTPEDKRPSNIDEDLNKFTYINGNLFKEVLPIPSFDYQMRELLLKCCRFDWSKVSPAVFGSMFQVVMDPIKRRNIGGHYTSEKNILKVIKSLFLDDLYEEFEKIKTSERKLNAFHDKLARLRFLDPACGCGNFLVITYRELRKLEIEILTHLRNLSGDKQLHIDVSLMSKIDVDNFYGIEMEEFPCRIAEVALWLVDHLMNKQLSIEFGSVLNRLPLKKTATILNTNALCIDWNTVLDKSKCSYILSNPPFGGKKEQHDHQKEDMNLVWGNHTGSGVLDYVTCWYKKAAEYIHGTEIRVGYVSTNSISQGEQVGILWSKLFTFGIKIHFAHTTFAWESEASGKAHVHVVVIGFSASDISKKTIFKYDTPKTDAHAVQAKNINPYLVDAPDALITKRTKPINNAPEIFYGSMMIDKARTADEDDGLIITDEERNNLLTELPALKKYIRKLLGGEEFINGSFRWCLWLVDAPVQLLRDSPRLRARLEKVKKFRLASNRIQTQKLAMTPYLFGEIRQPSSRYLLIPKVSSESRRYIPIGFIEPDIIASGSALIIPKATLYDFGIISSAMHNTWMRYVCGRMKSDYQYSNQIVYNNFPWPEKVQEKKLLDVESAANDVLNERKLHTETLADLYDPITMPKDLLDAHKKLDKAVDSCYGKKQFNSEMERMTLLFDLYKKYTSSEIQK